jgi:hypothetical protein
MADKDKRLRYYNGQFLQEQDFIAEQEYHLDRQRRHNRQLHTYGIAEGLTVTAGQGATSAVVAPGTAIDGEGQMIVLTESRTVPFNGLTGSVFVVISYSQQPSDPATVGDEGHTRWLERPDVEVIADDEDTPPADVRIRLARLEIVGTAVDEHDPSVRTSAGVQLGTEVTIQRIRLSRDGVDSAQWPEITSGAAGRADVTGNLSVTGNILVSGTVDGRDIAVDGARLDSLGLSTIDGVSNPGGNIDLIGSSGITVTANNVNKTITFAGNAPATIDGVSNAGGNIDLVGSNGITVTADNAAKTITFAGVGSPATIDGVSSPGGNIDLVGSSGITVTANNAAKTITFAGNAPASIDGVSNPNGNIDLVGQGGISITPDNSGKLIAFNTSPAAIGALATGDYLRRYINWGGFGTTAASGSLQSFNCGFTPKAILFHATVYGDFSGFKQTAVLSGMARVTSPGDYYVYGSRTSITRTNSAPYWKIEGRTGYYGFIGRVEFMDEAPIFWDNHTLLTLVLSEVNANGFVVRLDKSTNSFEVPAFTEFQFTVLG